MMNGVRKSANEIDPRKHRNSQAVKMISKTPNANNLILKNEYLVNDAVMNRIKKATIDFYRDSK